MPGSKAGSARMAVACTIVLAAAMPVRAAQAPVILRGTVVDREAGSPVSDATVVIRRLAPAGDRALVRTTGPDGSYRFGNLLRGGYKLTVERIGYEPVLLELALERDAPVVITIALEPLPFPLAALLPGRSEFRGPSLVPRTIRAGSDIDGRARSIRYRQQHFLSTDVRQLGRADLREANTLAEDDILRALQRTPGAGSRDDYGADLWTRGAPAGQTLVQFDGIPLIGGMHALGVLSGLNSDALASATFHPGVVGAALQGAGAGLIEVASRSRTDGGMSTASVSPVSARAATTGAFSDAVGWSLGLRRSYVDAVSALATDALPGGSLPYAFGDLTGRVDVVAGPGTRIEASFFWQADRVFGDVPDVAWGNDGSWGAYAARASLITAVGATVIRSTIGTSGFDAAVRAAVPQPGGPWPLHPTTENDYRTLILEGRLDTPDGWSAGVHASRELQEYNGPGIDLARLLTPDELARRGQAQLTPIILEIERSRLLKTDGMTRVAAWAERRHSLPGGLEMEGGLRIETGDPVEGGHVRLAPRVRARWRPDESAFTISAAYGRAWQYMQSAARTDVLRTGLRASEVLVQAGEDAPALRSDVMTLGAEAWAGGTWLIGATGWLRESSGVLLPDPTPGVIDESRQLEPAHGSAHGLELSVRRPEGRVRGFANYTLSRSRYRIGQRVFDASEDRRHMANIGVVADVVANVMVGATVRALSGSPYTRVTLIDTDCESSLRCSDQPVLIGTPSGQRSSGWSSIDLMAEWSHSFDDWSVSLYGQLRNAAGSANATTYHSSCLCVNGDAASSAGLSDRFDRGLPRLPVLGLRARF